jgi:hypothetical protein
VYVYTGGVWRMQGSGQVVTAEARNRIVNGAIQHSQEAGFQGGVTGNGSYSGDQWRLSFNGGGPISSSRNDNLYPSDPDSTNWLRLNGGSTVIGSPAASQFVQFNQPIEGIRMSDAKWGTVAAKPVVVRFRAAGSVAGTYCFAIRNGALNRAYVVKFSVTTTPQWFSFAIPGDTTGTWPTDTTQWGQIVFCGMSGTDSRAPAEAVWSAGLYVSLAGTSNLLSAASQMLDVTNVGLYLDPNATGVPPPWQMPDEAQELAACKRYYDKVPMTVSTACLYWSARWAATKRVSPAITQQFDVGSAATFAALSTEPLEGFYCSANHGSVATARITGNARM